MLLVLRTVYRVDAKYGSGRATRRWDGGGRRRPASLSFIGWRYRRILNEMPFDVLPLSGEDDSAFSYLLR